MSPTPDADSRGCKNGALMDSFGIFLQGLLAVVAFSTLMCKYNATFHINVLCEFREFLAPTCFVSDRLLYCLNSEHQQHPYDICLLCPVTLNHSEPYGNVPEGSRKKGQVFACPLGEINVCLTDRLRESLNLLQLLFFQAQSRGRVHWVSIGCHFMVTGPWRNLFWSPLYPTNSVKSAKLVRKVCK